MVTITSLLHLLSVRDTDCWEWSEAMGIYHHYNNQRCIWMSSLLQQTETHLSAHPLFIWIQDMQIINPTKYVKGGGFTDVATWSSCIRTLEVFKREKLLRNPMPADIAVWSLRAWAVLNTPGLNLTNTDIYFYLLLLLSWHNTLQTSGDVLLPAL